MSKTAADKYKTQQIMTASPARLVAMLFDKAISCLNDAIRAIEAGDVEARWKANGRAMEIVHHLLVTLEMEKGGDIARNLDQLYRFILARLPDVDHKNNPAVARDVIGLLEPLRRSWHAVANQSTSTLAVPAIPAPPAAGEKRDANPEMAKIAISA